MAQEQDLPPALKSLYRRWERIERETGVSLTEVFFGLFTPIDDRLRRIEELLEQQGGITYRIEEHLEQQGGITYWRFSREEFTQFIEEITKEITKKVIFPEEIKANLVGVNDEVVSKFVEGFQEPGVFEENHLVTYPVDGGYRNISTSGTVKVDFIKGQVTLPGGTVDSINSLDSYFLKPKEHFIRSLMVEASKSVKVELESGYEYTVPAATPTPVENLNLHTTVITVPANTNLRFIGSVKRSMLPDFISRSKEFYSQEFRDKRDVGTGGDVIDVTEGATKPPANQVIMYVEGDDVLLDFNESTISTENFKIRNGGSLSYPLLTEKIAVEAATGTATVYTRGLR